MQKSLDQAINRAAAIVCVSESTANELVGFVGESIENRVHVVTEGVSSFFYSEPDSDCLINLEGMPALGVPFVLAAGKISPRKNVHGLLKAMSKLENKIPHHLVLVGGKGWDTESLLSSLEDPKLAKRTHLLGYVTDDQLRALYAMACVYVHPSLYEGFGLTVLEAMAAGCPVITSNVYSLPEVAGDAGKLIDPTDTAALADAIETICLDEGLQNDMRSKGEKRAAEFSWERCAAEMLGIYGQVSK
jgi:glycosyltransferase involved in cell wall biosynthesis